jgi:hypothetical protein
MSSNSSLIQLRDNKIMCGFCTEMMAIDIAEHLRDHGTISDDDNSDNSLHFNFMLQEYDDILTSETGSEALDSRIPYKDGSVPSFYAAYLLARENLALAQGCTEFSPRAQHWLALSRAVMNDQTNDDPIALLEYYVNTCVQAADAPENEKAKPDFDVYAHLPTLVQGIILLGNGVGTSEQQSLLTTLAAGYPVNSPPMFDGVELWLERLAFNTLWQTRGMPAVLALIPLHVRPVLFYYLHCKFGLSTEQRITLANSLTAEGGYPFPCQDSEWVIEQLRDMPES